MFGKKDPICPKTSPKKVLKLVKTTCQKKLAGKNLLGKTHLVGKQLSGKTRQEKLVKKSWQYKGVGNNLLGKTIYIRTVYS